MSEKKASPSPSPSAPASTASTTSTSTTAAAPAAIAKTTTETTSTNSSSSGIQNGKGDAPRNISKRFRRNYDGIKWTSGGKKRKEGVKFIKSY